MWSTYKNLGKYPHGKYRKTVDRLVYSWAIIHDSSRDFAFSHIVASAWPLDTCTAGV